jgi:RHS repeat-associated protein
VDGSRRHFLTDLVGTIGMTLDDTGSAQDTIVRDAFGVALAGSTVERYGAIGQRETDSETGLIYARGRMLDPNRGAYIQLDPLRRNRATKAYAYASGNPVLRRDPFALDDVPEAGARIERTFLQSYGSAGQTLLDAFKASGGSVVYENRWWSLHSASRDKISIDNANEGIASEELLKALVESIATIDAPEKLKVATALGLEGSQLNYATVSAFAKPVGQVFNGVRTAAVILNPPGAGLASGIDHLANKEYLEGGLEILGAAAAPMKSLRALEEASPELRAMRPTVLQRIPRHHVFPQEEKAWFSSRGFDIDKFTIELDQGTHSALHTMKWNDAIMSALKTRETLKGAQLTESEILSIGKDVLERFKITAPTFVPFK